VIGGVKEPANLNIIPQGFFPVPHFLPAVVSPAFEHFLMKIDFQNPQNPFGKILGINAILNSVHPETPSPLAGEGGGEGNGDEKN
jgi:hypothetical protein